METSSTRSHKVPGSAPASGAVGCAPAPDLSKKPPACGRILFSNQPARARVGAARLDHAKMVGRGPPDPPRVSREHTTSRGASGLRLVEPTDRREAAALPALPAMIPARSFKERGRPAHIIHPRWAGRPHSILTLDPRLWSLDSAISPALPRRCREGGMAVARPWNAKLIPLGSAV
jgi:hypothetical protein